jgi:hypothetical protein
MLAVADETILEHPDTKTALSRMPDATLAGWNDDARSTLVIMPKSTNAGDVSVSLTNRD